MKPREYIDVAKEIAYMQSAREGKMDGCANCGSKNLDWDDVSTSSNGSATQHVECNDCGAGWTNVFELMDVVGDERKDPPEMFHPDVLPLDKEQKARAEDGHCPMCDEPNPDCINRALPQDGTWEYACPTCGCEFTTSIQLADVWVEKPPEAAIVRCRECAQVGVYEKEFPHGECQNCGNTFTADREGEQVNVGQ
jgi:hypothetical protein